MFFTILVLAAALVLEGLGSYISVVGLASKASPIIIFLAISLDFSKIMIATVLYKKWKDIHLLLRTFLIPALMFLMMVTSSGTYAFLLQEFSKTTAGQEQLTAKVDLLNKEKTKLELRKKEIDGQIAQLPPSSVLQRKRMTDLFSDEITHINGRIIELDKEIPQSTLAVMEGAGHTGTLGSIAKAYGTTAEQINKIIAFLIVLVVDPLAIVLLTVANFLMDQRRKDRKTLLLQKINGEMPLDEDSLLEQLKNKIKFMRSKLSDENLSIASILFDSKKNIIQKPMMTGKKINLPITHYVLAVNITEAPKVYVPVKYQTDFVNLDNSNILKESRPVIFKVQAQKEEVSLTTLDFVTTQNNIEPIEVIEPLSLQNIETLNNNGFIAQPISKKSIEAMKQSVILPVSSILLSQKETKPLALINDVMLDNIEYLTNKTVNDIQSLSVKNVVLDVNENKPLKKDSNYFIKAYELLNEAHESVVDLPVNKVVSAVRNKTANLSLEPTEEIISQDFLVDNTAPTNFLNNEETATINESNQKKKTFLKQHNIDYHNDGLFKDHEVKKFVPSNYHEPISYDDDDDLWEDELTTEDYQIDPIYEGFDTNKLLSEKIF